MKTTGLNFIEAVKAAQKGYLIRQATWVDGEALKLSSLGYFDPVQGDYKVELHIQHWLAEDWEIYTPPKTMTFAEAYKQVRQGKKIARLEWEETHLDMRELDNGNILFHVHYYDDEYQQYVTGNWQFFGQDYEATDWYVLTEENKND